MNLVQLIELASAVTDDAAEARRQALPATVTACRMIEKLLVETLKGEPLRGLKNIGKSGETFYGARVRTQPDTRIDHFEDCTDNEIFLCIDAGGRLTAVRWVLDDDRVTTDNGEPWWSLWSSPATDDQIRIGDADGMLRALHVVLPRHVEKSTKTAASYESAKLLAQRIQRSMTR